MPPDEIKKMIFSGYKTRGSGQIKSDGGIISLSAGISDLIDDKFPDADVFYFEAKVTPDGKTGDALHKALRSIQEVRKFTNPDNGDAHRNADNAEYWIRLLLQKSKQE